MRRHPLIAFVVLAYALTWALTIPFAVLLAIVFHTTFNTAESTLFRLFESPAEVQAPSIYFWTVGLTWVAAAVALLPPGGEPVKDPVPALPARPESRAEPRS